MFSKACSAVGGRSQKIRSVRSLHVRQLSTISIPYGDSMNPASCTTSGPARLRGSHLGRQIAEDTICAQLACKATFYNLHSVWRQHEPSLLYNLGPGSLAWVASCQAANQLSQPRLRSVSVGMERLAVLPDTRQCDAPHMAPVSKIPGVLLGPLCGDGALPRPSRACPISY